MFSYNRQKQNSTPASSCWSGCLRRRSTIFEAYGAPPLAILAAASQSMPVLICVPITSLSMLSQGKTHRPLLQACCGDFSQPWPSPSNKSVLRDSTHFCAGNQRKKCFQEPLCVQLSVVVLLPLTDSSDGVSLQLFKYSSSNCWVKKQHFLILQFHQKSFEIIHEQGAFIVKNLQQINQPMNKLAELCQLLFLNNAAGRKTIYSCSFDYCPRFTDSTSVSSHLVMEMHIPAMLV